VTFHLLHPTLSQPPMSPEIRSSDSLRTPSEAHRGFWLIDDKNRKQPFYSTLSSYYENMKRIVAEFRKEHGRLPTDNELRKKSVEILKQAGSEQSLLLNLTGENRGRRSREKGLDLRVTHQKCLSVAKVAQTRF
jgi:hypothetical protein